MKLLKINGQKYRVPWGPAAAILGTAGIFIAAQIVGAIIITLFAMSQGLRGDEIVNWIEDSVLGRFGYVVAVEAAVLILLFIFLHGRKAHPDDIGLSKPLLKDIGFALTGYAAYFVLFLVTLQIVRLVAPGLDLTQEQDIGFGRDIADNMLPYVFVSLVVLPPIVEEVLIRGFLYSGLRTRLNFWTAGLITGILFAIAHLQWGNEAPLLWIAAVDTFVLSWVLVYLREKTNRLWAPIGVHMIKNGVAFMALFVLNVV